MLIKFCTPVPKQFMKISAVYIFFAFLFHFIKRAHKKAKSLLFLYERSPNSLFLFQKMVSFGLFQETFSGLFNERQRWKCYIFKNIYLFLCLKIIFDTLGSFWLKNSSDFGKVQFCPELSNFIRFYPILTTGEDFSTIVWLLYKPWFGII